MCASTNRSKAARRAAVAAVDSRRPRRFDPRRTGDPRDIRSNRSWTVLQQMAAQRGTAFYQWILGLVNSPKHRVAGATAPAIISPNISAISHDGHQAQGRRAATALRPGTRRCWKTEAVAAAVCDSAVSPPPPLARRRLSQYSQFASRELALNWACAAGRTDLRPSDSPGRPLAKPGRRLNRLAERFRTQQAPRRPREPSAEGSDVFAAIGSRNHQRQKVELVLEIEHELESGKSVRILASTSARCAVACRNVARTARAIVLGPQAGDVAGDSRAQRRAVRPDPLFSLRRGGVEAATPRLSACGGGRRLLLVVPDGFSTDEFRRQLGETAAKTTVMTDADTDVRLCCETEQVELKRVAAVLLDNRYQAVELASRLHTRIDVAWSPL